MQISFYVLGERFKQHDITSSTASALDADAVLNFVCRLTHTVLTKSDHSLLIIDDQTERLTALDEHLWSFDATSFIPHNLILEDVITLDKLSAPVTLVKKMIPDFDGVVLNLAPTAPPISTHGTLPEKILEIITSDETSKQQGRDKYRIYRDLGFELIYFPIN
ncbi:DNA polymerase III subunit chi [Psychrobacter sp.]|uniref:DNA polymerase III subunit chi n=1 Tax=Psychrobacter sp. TaxID=56811 RepID=UPI0025EC78B4|nr:DNA polymerase III subunit chi [Psychrobacter sp.]